MTASDYRSTASVGMTVRQHSRKDVQPGILYHRRIRHSSSDPRMEATMLSIRHELRGWTCAAFLAAPLLATGSSQAQHWPHRTVRLITPNNVGSGGDLTARLFRGAPGRTLGPPVIVENRQGADGILAVTSFLGARDDHTLLFSFAGVISINPLIHDRLPYDPAHDLVPIVSAADNFFGIVVPEATEGSVRSTRFDKARSHAARQVQLGRDTGRAALYFRGPQQSTGIEMIRASYRDFAPALSDLGEGRIHAASGRIGSSVVADPGGQDQAFDGDQSRAFPARAARSDRAARQDIQNSRSKASWAFMVGGTCPMISGSASLLMSAPLVTSPAWPRGSRVRIGLARRDAGRVCRGDRGTAVQDLGDCSSRRDQPGR